MSVWIKNAEIVTMDEAQGIIKGSLLIEDGTITGIYPHEQEADAPLLSAVEVIDADWNLLIPGMSNAHYHSYSNLLKGTRSNLPLELWSLYTIAYGHSLDDEDIYLAVLLGAADMIRSGITGCIDHFPHLLRVNSALRAYEKSQMNVTIAPMIQDVSDEEFLGFSDKKSNLLGDLSEIRDFFSNLFHNWHLKNEKIEIMLGPNAPQRCSQQALRLCKDLSDQFGVNVHTHLLETKIQKVIGDRTYSNGMLGHLNEAGLLNHKLSVAHAVWLDYEEMDLLKEKKVSIVHNPASNMTLGSGVAPVSRFMKDRMLVGLGSDASNCGISHRSFEMMRLSLMLSRINSRNYEEWLEPSDVFKMATRSGANIISGSKRGKIAEGYDADLVLINRSSSSFILNEDLISQLVFYENGESVEAVMIKGAWVYWEDRILAFDEQEVIRQVQEKSSELRKKVQGALSEAEKKKRILENFYRQFYN
ncbi:amidohydrolase family protein [Halobacillus sp. A5]|uniref:amidohydrolase family protein n=1 Tax=Halobacillus sp. A5 TaxID=2880263 RepID=UPI0020A66491|nr:amidohydrolase family protein [Halobacillus sp. A5]MCP3027924.1 amidohydrolase family protein [Halobacillus sp. A5]